MMALRALRSGAERVGPRHRIVHRKLVAVTLRRAGRSGPASTCPAGRRSVPHQLEVHQQLIARRVADALADPGRSSRAGGWPPRPPRPGRWRREPAIVVAVPVEPDPRAGHLRAKRTRAGPPRASHGPPYRRAEPPRAGLDGASEQPPQVLGLLRVVSSSHRCRRPCPRRTEIASTDCFSMKERSHSSAYCRMGELPMKRRLQRHAGLLLELRPGRDVETTVRQATFSRNPQTRVAFSSASRLTAARWCGPRREVRCRAAPRRARPERCRISILASIAGSIAEGLWIPVAQGLVEHLARASSPRPRSGQSWNSSCGRIL